MKNRSRTWRIVLPLLGMSSVALATHCTFYTAPPVPNTSGGAGSPNANGGNGATGAGTSSRAGRGGEELDDAGAGAPDPGAWVDATGDLAKMSSGLLYLSAKPSEDMLIAGLSGYGLWASRDGGSTWQGLGQSGLSDLITNGVTSVVYDPAHSDVFWETGIYVGTAVYRTDDNGDAFKALGLNHIEYLSVDFSDAKRRTLVAGVHETTKALSLSTDGGKTWDETLGRNLPDECGFSTFPLVLDSKTFLLGCVTRIVKTTDQGASWKTVSLAGGCGVPVQTPDGNIYWVIDGDGGLMKSTDDGDTWRRVVGAGVIKSPITTHRSLPSLIALPDGRLAGITGDQLAVSGDDGKSWSAVGPKLPFNTLGLVYSSFQRAFYVYRDSVEPEIPDESIMRLPFDWEAP